jgi:hypothetical protein
MKELKKSKEDVFLTLRLILETHNNYIKIKEKGVAAPDFNPIEKTLQTYHDFYEWLEGKT